MDLQTYYNSLEEGDTITITADFLNAMEEALEIRYNFFREMVILYVESLADELDLTDEQITQVANKVEEDNEVWNTITASIDWFINKTINK